MLGLNDTPPAKSPSTNPETKSRPTCPSIRTNQETLIKCYSDNKLARRFYLIAECTSSILGKKGPTGIPSPAIRWANIPLTYDGPRFGVVELPLKGLTARLLLVAEGLRRAPSYLLDWVLWREAILEHLCRPIRLVPEAADLGLYGGLKYGIKNPNHRRHLQQLWETLSPPQYHDYYRYEPAVGFAIFDNVVDGKLLQKVIPWLNTLCGDRSLVLSSNAFTAALERWMMETHRVLNEVEVSILSALSSSPSLSQTQLAKQLKISRASINQSLRTLASTHLLRLISYVDLPLIGLKHIVVILRLHPQPQLVQRLKRLFMRFRYTHAIRSFPDSVLLVELLLPSQHVNHFYAWLHQLCYDLNLPPPSLHVVTGIALSRSFNLYTPDMGWPTDFSPILVLVQRAIKGEMTDLPPLRISKYSYTSPLARSPLSLHPWDFNYLRRSTDASLITNGFSSHLAREARQLGLSKSMYMRYRRRIYMLEQIRLCTPIGLGLLHVGLDAVIYILLSASREMMERILRACNLLPYVYGVLYRGGGVIILLVPNHAAIEVYSSLRTVFAECGVNAIVTARPAWQAFVMLRSPIDDNNYDFRKSEWIWTPGISPF